MTIEELFFSIIKDMRELTGQRRYNKKKSIKQKGGSARIRMVDLLLIYPYYNNKQAIFKFPPLGIGYIASYVKQNGFSVRIIDCTFKTEEKVIMEAKSLKPSILGIYSNVGMIRSAIRIAKKMRGYCDLMVVGGPLPSYNPELFLEFFDVIVIGEGEETVLEILRAFRSGDLSHINGIVYMERRSKSVRTPPRSPIQDLDSLPLPAREMYEHSSYKEHYKRYHGYTVTSMITSRGCPFDCDFCSNPVFGRFYRSRSPASIVDELATIASFGYDRVFLSDDIFPINKKFGIEICDEIVRRGLDVTWECLCRADLNDQELASKMSRAGCYRVFLGLESGNDEILKVMNKHIRVDQAREAVLTLDSQGIKVGAFFMLGYPGESNRTMLDTIRFASSLPLNYLRFAVPYPIPGTGLYEKLRDRITTDEWRKLKHGLTDNVLLYDSEFPMAKLKLGMWKAYAQRHLRRYHIIGKTFEFLTDCIFKII